LRHSRLSERLALRFVASVVTFVVLLLLALFAALLDGSAWPGLGAELVGGALAVTAVVAAATSAAAGSVTGFSPAAISAPGGAVRWQLMPLSLQGRDGRLRGEPRRVP